MKKVIWNLLKETQKEGIEMEFYRYEITTYFMGGTDVDSEYTISSFPATELKLKTYPLLRETPQGYWISLYGLSYSPKKWVSKTGRKRFAYPTQEEALNNFIRRTEKRVKYLENDLSSAQRGLVLAIKEQEKLKS